MAADGEKAAAAAAGVEGGGGGGRVWRAEVTTEELLAVLQELAVGDEVTIKIAKASRDKGKCFLVAVAQREDREMKSLHGAGPSAAPPRPRPRPPYSRCSTLTPTPGQRRVAGIGRPHPVPRTAPLPRPPCRPLCCAAPPPPCSPVQRRPTAPRAPRCSAAPPPPRPPYSRCSAPTQTPVQRSAAPGHQATRDARPPPPATRRLEAPVIRRRAPTASRQRRVSAHLTTPAMTTQPPPIPLTKPSPARDGRVEGTDRRADEEAMPRRRRRGGGRHGYMEQDHPPATGHRLRRREEEAPSHLPPPQEQQPSASLLDDVLFEILSRVPYRSLCRFKCVSKPWLALCSDPGVRRRSPQTLSGFFYYGSDDLCFHNLSGKGPPLVDPSLPFLRGSYERFLVEASCSSLLLFRCWRLGSQVDEFDYVVCNPATEEWTALPPIELLDQEDGHLLDFDEAVYYLGFDAAVPSRFVVFAALYNYDNIVNCEEMVTYSSETG